MIRKAFVIVLVLLAMKTASSQPLLKVSPESYDFGITVPNSIIVHKAWIKSSGTDTVRVEKVSTGCTCTSMPLEKDKIAPGDSVQVEIRWNTNRMRGPSKQYPRIYYKNSEKELRLALTAIFVNVPDSNLSVTAWPFRFELGRLPDRSIDSIEFRIKNNSAKDIEVYLASHEIEQCELQLPKILPAHSNSFGFIKIKPEHLGEEFEDSYTLKFSHDVKHVLTIPVRRKIYSASAG